MSILAKFSIGDVCSYRRKNGAWGFFWIVAIDPSPKIGAIYSLRKFDTHTAVEITPSDREDIAELMKLPLKGHFPIVEEKVKSAAPVVLGHKPVEPDDLDGYRIWKKAFDSGEAGVFTIDIEQV